MLDEVDFIMGICIGLILIFILIFLYGVSFGASTGLFTQTIDGSQYIANYTIQNHWQAPATCIIHSFVVYVSQNGTLKQKNIFGNQTALDFLENQTQAKNCTYKS